MLHTIATLEVQLLIKDVVDEACLQAARRPHDLALSLKVSFYARWGVSAGCYR